MRCRRSLGSTVVVTLFAGGCATSLPGTTDLSQEGCPPEFPWIGGTPCQEPGKTCSYRQHSDVPPYAVKDTSVCSCTSGIWKCDSTYECPFDGLPPGGAVNSSVPFSS